VIVCIVDNGGIVDDQCLNFSDIRIALLSVSVMSGIGDVVYGGVIRSHYLCYNVYVCLV